VRTYIHTHAHHMHTYICGSLLRDVSLSSLSIVPSRALTRALSLGSLCIIDIDLMASSRVSPAVQYNINSIACTEPQNRWRVADGRDGTRVFVLTRVVCVFKVDASSSKGALFLGNVPGLLYVRVCVCVREREDALRESAGSKESNIDILKDRPAEIGRSYRIKVLRNSSDSQSQRLTGNLHSFSHFQIYFSSPLPQ
jgi:hypothetical protein